MRQVLISGWKFAFVSRHVDFSGRKFVLVSRHVSFSGWKFALVSRHVDFSRGKFELVSLRERIFCKNRVVTCVLLVVTNVFSPELLAGGGRQF